MGKATRAQLEDFKESFIWEDIKEELIHLYKQSGLEYDSVGEPPIEPGKDVNPLIHLGEIKGHRKAVRYFLDIPDILIKLLEDEEDDSERSGAD